MTILPINGISTPSNAESIEALTPPSTSFSTWITEKISETNQELLNADHALQQLALNQAPNLHEVMLSLEQAKLSFQFVEQIRTRLLSAYQELLREPI